MSEDQLRAWMETNRQNWDDCTTIHLRNLTGFYPIDRVRAGDDAFGEPKGCRARRSGWQTTHSSAVPFRARHNPLGAAQCDRYWPRLLYRSNRCRAVTGG